MKTYRDLLKFLACLDPTDLDSPISIADQDDSEAFAVILHAADAEVYANAEDANPDVRVVMQFQYLYP